MKMKTVLFVVTLALILVGCGGPSACDEYVVKVQENLIAWNDSLQLASRASRLALPPYISDLQDIRRQALTIEVPACGAESHSLYLKHQELLIDGFIEFMDRENTDAEKTMEEGFTVFREWQDKFYTIDSEYVGTGEE